MTNKIIRLNDGSIETQHTLTYSKLAGTSPSENVCLHCGRVYIPEIWILINDDLRPICPYCGDP